MPKYWLYCTWGQLFILKESISTYLLIWATQQTISCIWIIFPLEVFYKSYVGNFTVKVLKKVGDNGDLVLVAHNQYIT